MDRTRSGRVVKKSSKLEENDDDDSVLDYFDGQMQTDEFGDDYIDPMTEAIARPSSKRKSNLIPRKENHGLSNNSNGKISLMGILGNNDENFTRVNPTPIRNDKIIVANKNDPAYKFYGAIRKMMNTNDLTYPILRSQSVAVSESRHIETMNIVKNDYPKFKFDSNEHTVIIGTEKTNEKIKEILGVDMDYEELSKVNRLTTYYLFVSTTKRKMELNGVPIDKNQLSKDLTKTWTKMPERTRRDWEIKTNRIKRQIDEQLKREKSEAMMNRQKYHTNIEKAKSNVQENKLSDYDLSDVCGYLQALSIGMNNLSQELRLNPNSQVPVKQVESRLLDYLLSSMVSLVALFEEDEGLDRDVSKDSLNKLTFVLPS